jgi:predicted RNase H-like HicB family nuclease
MNQTIDLDREVDGRWIAEVPELNIILYGSSREDAIQQAEDAARQIIADRIQRLSAPLRSRFGLRPKRGWQVRLSNPRCEGGDGRTN